MAKAQQGHIYILVSDRSDCVKIGGTDFQPFKRLKEINAVEPYRGLGPWRIVDFRQVTDWRLVESNLHFKFRDFAATDIIGQRELFRISPQAASAELGTLDPATVTKRPVIDRMFQDAELWSYIRELFCVGGLLNWLEIQGAWTFTLFPATGGGRYFTLNIDKHEVAFSTPANMYGPQRHMIVLDSLIADFPETVRWIRGHGGVLSEAPYASAMDRAIRVDFPGSFSQASEFLTRNGVRRALIAYWLDGLMRLKETGSSSFFARFHNWNAVAEIRRRIALET